MARKHVIKRFGEHEYFHIYNRGVNKQPIFLDIQDKDYFIGLLDRYLNPESTQTNSNKMEYTKFDDDVDLLSYCLMDNHYHFLFWLENGNTAISELMKCVGTAYTMYFNRKYDRVGPLFQSTYKANRITSDPFLLHITRYIHLNPGVIYDSYEYSSFKNYISKTNPRWLNPQRVLELFDDIDYRLFVDEYYKYSKDFLDTDDLPVDN